MQTSSLCRYNQLRSPELQKWVTALGRSQQTPHRKDWELAFIARVVEERGKMGGFGIGFGVGVEPLPALFASQGCSITATDRPDEVEEWRGQYSNKVEMLERYSLLSEQEKERIQFIPVDMRNIPSELHGKYDFCWSTSSMEHLGGLTAAEKFVSDSLKCLKPGGVAVHVTETSVYPWSSMPDDRGTVFFTRARATALLHDLNGEPLVVDYGSEPEDYYVDFPPFNGPSHLKLFVDGFVTTSIGMIFVK